MLHRAVAANLIRTYKLLCFSDFLPDNQVQLFTKWVFTFGKEMITHSTRYEGYCIC